MFCWKLRPVIHLKAVEHHGFRCPGDGGAPGAGADGGDGKGNGRGNGKGNGKGNAGGGKPEEPARERPDAGGMGQACAGVSCPTGAQFCLNGTCHAVTSP